MLNPDQRSLLTSLLTPPTGMVFDTGLATTFTLDPLSLLTVPLHLAWLASGEDGSLLSDGVRLLEALRRVADRFTVYAQRGRIQAPSKPYPLYVLLETCIAEVGAPHGGVFHPKLWVLRFSNPDRPDDALLRLGILSRNLTGDRSWDLALQLEGRPSGRSVAANKQLASLIQRLPALAIAPVDAKRCQQAQQLARELERTTFEVPSPWDEVTFHTLGLEQRSRAFILPESDELAVISPFVRADALAALCKTTKAPFALVSRPEELAELPSTVRQRFSRCLILDEAAETEDGEEVCARDAVGLHAKAYLAERGGHTHLFIGSANATDAALLGAKNVEVLAELRGQCAKTGKVQTLLDSKGLGGLLVDFDPTTSRKPRDPEQVSAEQALETAQAAMARATLKVCCESRGSDTWQLSVVPDSPVALGAVAIVAWPLSLSDEQAVDGERLGLGQPLPLASVATADVTGLIGFSLSCRGLVRRFALNLPLQGLPERRDAAILRRILLNREGFLRYLRMLLGDLNADLPLVGGTGADAAAWSFGGSRMESLLEDLVRAFARDRERLEAIDRIVEQLRSEGGEDIVPPEFLSVWGVFTRAMRGSR